MCMHFAVIRMKSDKTNYPRGDTGEALELSNWEETTICHQFSEI